MVQGGVMHVNLVLAEVLRRLMTASAIAMPAGEAAGEPCAGWVGAALLLLAPLTSCL